MYKTAEEIADEVLVKLAQAQKLAAKIPYVKPKVMMTVDRAKPKSTVKWR
jgi:hypothetical protein